MVDVNVYVTQTHPGISIKDSDQSRNLSAPQHRTFNSISQCLLSAGRNRSQSAKRDMFLAMLLLVSSAILGPHQAQAPQRDVTSLHEFKPVSGRYSEASSMN